MTDRCQTIAVASKPEVAFVLCDLKITIKLALRRAAARWKIYLKLVSLISALQ